MFEDNYVCTQSGQKVYFKINSTTGYTKLYPAIKTRQASIEQEAFSSKPIKGLTWNPCRQWYRQKSLSLFVTTVDNRIIARWPR